MASAEHARLISSVIDAGFRLHKELGPGLLESVYEAVLASRLERLGVKVIRQMPVNITVDGINFVDAYRADLFLDDWLVIELKALEKLTGVHVRQAHTYVRLLNQPYGLILNFGAELLPKASAVFTTTAEQTQRIFFLISFFLLTKNLARPFDTIITLGGKYDLRSLCRT
jgi:iron complex transport system substrate-binding protein